VLASASIPAVFPPVDLDGLVLFDGGVADNTPISQAATLIARARDASRRWLDEGGHRRRHPERFLSLHGHQGSPSALADCRGGHAA
jgi:predicted acylesterase/phospholipase RssA